MKLAAVILALAVIYLAVVSPMTPPTPSPGQFCETTRWSLGLWSQTCSSNLLEDPE